MIGGLLKTTSAAALLVAAGLSMGVTQVSAADYGGDCCADLEERVAELEATTVRHANRKVSLTISGSVTEAVLYWDDGRDSDVNVILPDTTGAGFTLSAAGKVNSDISVGAIMGINVRAGDPGDGASTLVPGFGTAGSLQVYSFGTNISVDQEYVYIDSKSAGRVSLGYRNGAYKSFNNGAFDLGGASGIHDYLGGTIDLAAGINIRDGVGNFRGSWYNVLSNVGGAKGMVIRYDSPTVAGFSLSASWGGRDNATVTEEDVGSVGLAYSGSFSGTDVSAGVAYESRDVTDDRLTAGLSIYNAPSGIYVTGEYNVQYATNDDPTTYFIKGGWRKNVNGLGETNIYLSYLHSEDFTATVEGQAFTVGAAQDLDAVGATLFLQYDNRSVVSGDAALGCVGSCEDLSTVLGGMRVTF